MPATLTERADFQRAAKGRKAATPGFVLQARPNGAGLSRVGYTCSRKVGGAVQRNRSKRRLRALARAVLPDAAREGWDYVLIGRARTTAERPMPLMEADLRGALGTVHA